MKHASTFFFLLLLFACARTVAAKGSPDLIVITRASGCSIEISDRETLKGFDPWMGQFIDWTKRSATDPSAVAQSANLGDAYQVFFFKKWNDRHSDYDRGDLKMIYSFSYSPGSNGSPGLIYLPGPNDRRSTSGANDRYRINIGTILHEGEDGKWHQASVGWETLMKRVTAAQRC